MNYFEFENKVIEKLNELLKIESTSITDYTVRLNFANDFHYEFNKKILKEAYGQGYSEDFISFQIKEDICLKYVDTFLERKGK